MYFRPSVYLLAFGILLGLSACNSSSESITDTSGDLQEVERPVPTTNPTSPSSIEEAKREDYRNTNRMIWQKPEIVIDQMGDISNKVIADIGAGTGFFAFKIARKAKKVIAIDIDPYFINYLDSAKIMELPESAQAKLEARLGEEDNPNIAKGEVDIILMANTYMYIRAAPGGANYLKRLRDLLPENGEVVIIDFKKKKLPDPIVNVKAPQSARVPLYVVENDLVEAGFRNIISNDKDLDYQYIISARK